ncbi:MAG: helix-turn-helix transcriptional regulator [Spirochaetales bacterium]|nr:helix-turn-helix transcriptional regulator [Spirochaetales bacterium]
MSDLQKYISKRKKNDKDFAEGFDKGYENFKIGAVLRQARLDKGITQEDLANLINTRKTAISRIENHAEDIRLSTLEKIAHALDREVRIELI